jgi:hypothetical protein
MHSSKKNYRVDFHNHRTEKKEIKKFQTRKKYIIHVREHLTMSYILNEVGVHMWAKRDC